MNVHVRERVGKDKKIIYLYLEVYKGYTRKNDGTIKANRTRKKLDYYLYAKPKTSSQKSHNKDVKRKVEAIKGQTLNNLLNGKYGFRSESKSKSDFIEYFYSLTQEKYSSSGNYGNWHSALKHLRKFSNQSISFENVNEDFCNGFKNYLKEVKTKSGKNLSPNSISSYFNKLRASLNNAVDEGIILSNPARNIKIPKEVEAERVFLTEEELIRLEKTECRYDVLKNAFLFSCYTGLRWSDIQKLSWSELKIDGDQWGFVFNQKKTLGLQYHPIPNKAKNFLGTKIEDERIFVGLKYSAYMNTAISQWVLRAGITKHITFHCARHTYATLLLTKGADLYTVSKLLGHKEIKTTQIYAKIIDQKKIDTTNLLDLM